jgi:hypothetical protein
MKVNHWIAAVAAVLISCFAAMSGSAAIVANFADGNDDTNGGANPPTVDSFRGAAGDGWNGAWTRQTNFLAASLVQFTTTVSNSTPLNGGGNYLSATLDASALTSGTFGQAAVARKYDAMSGGVDPTLPHVISFDFRPDVALQLGSLNDRFQIFDNVGGFQSSTLSSNTWVLAAYGSGSGGPIGTVAGNWGFISGSTSSNAFTSQTFIDTGLTITAGTTYHVEIQTDPDNKEWTASISDGNSTFNSGTLLWRNQGVNTAGTYLHWGALRTSAAASGPVTDFSLDNIAIWVPEPPSVALLALGLAATMCVGTSRRRLDDI